MTEDGKTRHAVIIGSPNINPGYKLVNNAAYPGIARDYERMFQVLKSLPCDYFLGAHDSYFDMEAKYSQLKAGARTPFIDPEGYRKYVAQKDRDFQAEMVKQKERGGFSL